MCLLAISIYSLENIFKSSAHFSLDFFSILSYLSYLHILNINLLLVASFANIFFHSVVFCFVNVFFFLYVCVAFILSLIKSYLSN